MAKRNVEVIYFGDPGDEPEEASMEFRLTYAGELKSTANDSTTARKAEHKHALRMAFHPQLKRLWEITPFLKTGERSGPDVLLLSGDMQKAPPPDYSVDTLSKRHSLYGWNFVPLVTKDLDLWCGMDILFLRPGKPGHAVNQGDVDGRLKTLLDALAIPDANQGYSDRDVIRGPLFTLLEDDRLISKVSVETDEMLELEAGKINENFVRLVITVSIRPYEMHLGNMQFG